MEGNIVVDLLYDCAYKKVEKKKKVLFLLHVFYPMSKEHCGEIYNKVIRFSYTKNNGKQNYDCKR